MNRTYFAVAQAENAQLRRGVILLPGNELQNTASQRSFAAENKPCRNQWTAHHTDTCHRCSEKQSKLECSKKGAYPP